MLGITVQILSKLAGQVGFVVLPRRWCVERTFSWINRCRRTVRDYERLPEHHAATVYWAMIIIMGRRLAHHQAAGQIPPQPLLQTACGDDRCYLRASAWWSSSTCRRVLAGSSCTSESSRYVRAPRGEASGTVAQ
jgi:hypothetical protein